MAKILTLGAGLVGRAIALDLAARHEVTAADVDDATLRELGDRHGIATTRLDVRDAASLADAAAGFDLVVSAVPGALGFETLKTVIDSGRDVVDISFCPEDSLALDALARERGVTAIVDMGLAPGMDNVLLGHHDRTMTVTGFECLVGGLPVERTWPFAYKAPFSPADVIEEYTRPARYVVNGRQVTRPALSDPELVEFAGIGTLEAFNTDGLRSLLVTMRHVPNMKEKTLRYPGHAELIRALSAAGFFDQRKLRVGAAEISPLEVTARILRERWALAPGERELTVMRVTIRGEQEGSPRTYVYHLHDEYDEASGLSSMARTTGYACTAVAEAVCTGLLSEHGVFPPEHVGADHRCFTHILSYLEERGVAYRAEER